MASIKIYSVFSIYLLTLFLLFTLIKTLELNNNFNEAKFESLLREQQQNEEKIKQKQFLNNVLYYEPQLIDNESENNLLNQELQNSYFDDNSRINDENTDELLHQNDIKNFNDDDV